MSESHPLFEQLARERLVYNDPPTAPFTAVEPRRVDDLTGDDHLAERTDNGLRPEDFALGQPPQDPAWRPDADR